MGTLNVIMEVMVTTGENILYIMCGSFVLWSEGVVWSGSQGDISDVNFCNTVSMRSISSEALDDEWMVIAG